MNPIKQMFRPDPTTLMRISRWPAYRLWTLRILVVAFLCLWMGLWYYLRVQVEQSQAKVQRKRIEAERRKESARRQATYQQALERYKQAPKTQTQRYGM